MSSSFLEMASRSAIDGSHAALVADELLSALASQVGWHVRKALTTLLALSTRP